MKGKRQTWIGETTKGQRFVCLLSIVFSFKVAVGILVIKSFGIWAKTVIPIPVAKSVDCLIAHCVGIP